MSELRADERTRSHRIDLKGLDLLALVEQLIQATRSGTGTSLSHKADWTVTASWLLLLCSHLMLPPADPRQLAAAGQAHRLQAQLLGLQEARALTHWLDARPQLGREVFARGDLGPGEATRPDPEPLNWAEFLWACIALFDGDWSKAAIGLSAVYVPRPPDLYTVEEARDQVRHVTQSAIPSVLVSLAELLPPQERNRWLPDGTEPPVRARHRSAWTSTLMACLELTKQRELKVEQLEHAALPGVGAV